MSVITVANLISVHRLQRRALPLCPNACHLPAQSPLWSAITGSLGRDDNAIVTLVADSPSRQPGDGFVQLRPLRRRQSAAMLYIAPAPEDDEVPAVWDSLLTQAANWAMARGVMRVLAAVPAAGPAEGGFVRNGWVRYAGDTVFERPFPDDARGGSVRLRKSRPVDDWAQQQLRAAVTPLRVQQAEGLSGPGPDDSGWTEQLVLSDGAEIQAEIRLHRGSTCHWVQLRARPGLEPPPSTLVQEALARLSRWPARPVRCSVPHYQADLAAALRESGFAPVGERALLVRHSVVPVRPALEESVQRLQAALGNARKPSLPEPSNSMDRSCLATAGCPSLPEWSDDRSTHN